MKKDLNGCYYEHHKIESLVSSTKEVIEEMGSVAHEIKGMTQEISILTRQNNNFFKIVLIVICVIALGKELVVEIKDMFVSKVIAQSEEK